MESKNLPAIVVRGIVPIPNNDFRTEIGRPISFKALDESENSFGNYILILIQKNPLIENPTPEDIEEYGVLAKTTMKLKLPNGNLKAKFNVISRIKVKEYFLTSPFFVAEYEETTTITSDIDQEMTLVRMVMSEVVNNANIVLNNAQEVVRTVQSGLTTDKLVDTIVAGLKGNEQDKYRYIAEQNLNTRLKMVLEDVAKQKMVSELEQHINE